MFSGADNGLIVILVAGTFFVLLLIAALMVYVYLHQQKVLRFKTELHEQELQKQQEVYLALNDGEEKERKRLAEELHDGLGARLSGLKMSMEYLSGAKIDKEEYELLLGKVMHGMNETVEELREISQNLQPSFLQAKGLRNALEDMIAMYNAKKQVKIALYLDGDLDVPDTRIELLVFRIVSELVNNTLKHSGAATASVQVMQGDDHLQIMVEDDGHGFSQEQKPGGMGMLNLRNRIQAVGGNLNIDSNAGGSTFIVEIPLTKST